MKSNYELKPKVKLDKSFGTVGKVEDLVKKVAKAKVIVIETYPGVRLEEVKKNIISKLKPELVIWSEDLALQGDDFRKAILPEMTEDRVFGKFTKKEYKDYFNKAKITKAKKDIEKCKGQVVVYGTGASYIAEGDKLIYIDIPRWDIQLRYRKKERVFFGGTLEDETTKNFKRGYFVEWRMADKIKLDLFNKFNFIIDGANEKFPFITASQFKKAINETSKRPFRLVPYFDAGVWGGKWMEEKFDLGTNEYSKWAWGFDGVPEENSIIFGFTNGAFEIPAINLVFLKPKNLLGAKVEKRFGAEFPIRFDFLDTIKGGNLSLQVHPTNEYIKKFGAAYTQEESYYILDIDKSSKEKPSCYLGVKDGVKPKEFIDALNNAQKTNKMDVEKFVNRYEAKKHDHFIHPAGVVHSSASGCMVLEISATPYIFTFKLWDWGRVDLNGKPRPINIEHGSKVIDYSFDTKRTTKELVSPFVTLKDTKEYKEEKTGLHERQFIETRRFTIKSNKGAVLKNNGSVNMLNLIEGDEAIVESLDKSFAPLVVHFAETFIVPESCKEYKVKPYGKSKDKSIMLLQAYVRS